MKKVVALMLAAAASFAGLVGTEAASAAEPTVCHYLAQWYFEPARRLSSPGSGVFKVESVHVACAGQLSGLGQMDVGGDYHSDGTFDANVVFYVGTTYCDGAVYGSIRGAVVVATMEMHSCGTGPLVDTMVPFDFDTGTFEVTSAVSAGNFALS